MTDPTTLLALAERCEQAAGPERELDAEIALAVGYTREKKGRERIAWWRDPKGRQLTYDSWRNFPPAFTSSLDAAVTLVPDWCRWLTSSAGLAVVWTSFPETGSAAATPALALCAAALRAMAAAV